mmetsp:Transcript_136419/g.380231  ORF Transcript_136419/g.380231 Transcript_136419/m.380231 type:complete len:618 (-) Transcript_136419:167-2020(-)
MLGAPPGFFSRLVPTVAESLTAAYPELRSSAQRVQEVLAEEEAAFDRTVERGVQFFTELRGELEQEGTKVVPGDRAFLLYDSHGFPLDLTQQMAEEAGLSVDVDGFDEAMIKQKERSRDALREQQAQEKGMRPLELVAEQTAWLESHGVAPTDDSLKYEWGTEQIATVRAIFSEEGFVDSTEGLGDGAVVGIVLDRTPFYAEAGGQVCDIGELSSRGGPPLLEVREARLFGGFVLHSGLLPTGAARPLRVGADVSCAVDYNFRGRVAPNHTMTHVLNWALREVLGDGVEQRGSLAGADRLRFDFSADSVNTKQLQRVEELVQGVVEAAAPVTTREVPLEEARRVAGVRAVAGEAYPDPVRVVTVGATPLNEVLAAPEDQRWRSQSVEFCGGTHISNAAEASAFAVLEEKAIAKGVRRIVAATGAIAQEARSEGQRVAQRVAELEEAKKSLDEAEITNLSKDLDAALMSAVLKSQCRDRLDALRKKLKKKQKGATKAVVDMVKTKLSEAVAIAVEQGAGHCVVQVEDVDAKALQQAMQGSAGIAVLALATTADGAVNCVATVPEDCRADGATASGWVSAALAPLEGRGGGSDSRAQGSARGAAEGISTAAEAARKYWG